MRPDETKLVKTENIELNILIIGVGGQGTLLASRFLGDVALGLGRDVKVSEVHGMSQRGGSVETCVRIGDNVASPIIDRGMADVVLSFESVEALRALNYLKPGGTVIMNTQEILPMPVISGAATYPENEVMTSGSLSPETNRMNPMRHGTVP